MKYIGLCFLAMAYMVAPIVRAGDMSAMLGEAAARIDARTGVAAWSERGDTLLLNGGTGYPMLSVYKFPQAIAVADYCERNGISFADSIDISAGMMREGTYSPMRDRYGVRDMRLPLSEVLAYSLQQSDNNACDILFGMIGGPAVADSVVRSLGIDGISIRSTEHEMHVDTGLCAENSSTPEAMARLMDVFCRELRPSSRLYGEIGEMMESSVTGIGRLPAPLAGTGAVIGHKTGTGDTDDDGRIIAVNDAGYVCLPDGRRYVIAVFVSGSRAGMAETESVIAEISSMVYDFMCSRE